MVFHQAKRDPGASIFARKPRSFEALLEKKRANEAVMPTNTGIDKRNVPMVYE
jgi:hypothetical protein